MSESEKVDPGPSIAVAVAAPEAAPATDELLVDAPASDINPVTVPQPVAVEVDPERHPRRQLRPRRNRTIRSPRLSTDEVSAGIALERDNFVALLRADRPKNRGDCKDGVRPCPWVSCKHNLYVDVNPETGSIKLNFPELEVWEMKESCALDVADRGGITLEEVGEILNLTRERVRQVEVRALFRLKEAREGSDL